MPVDAVLLEELAANAWPAATVQNVDGWRLRYTPGVGRRRSNSVLPPADPFAEGALAVPTVLTIATDFYARRGLPVQVQVTPAERQRRLDGWLAGSELRAGAPTDVLVATVEDVLARCDSTGDVRARCDSTGDVHVGGRDEEWMETWSVDARADAEAVGRLVLDRIGPPAGYGRLRHGGRTVSVGMAVAERGWAGLFCMGTAPDQRRRGYSLAVLGALAAWASSQGATSLYLQVETVNTAAQALYRGVGFTRSHGYHYRTVTQSQATFDHPPPV